MLLVKTRNERIMFIERYAYRKSKVTKNIESQICNDENTDEKLLEKIMKEPTFLKEKIALVEDYIEKWFKYNDAKSTKDIRRKDTVKLPKMEITKFSGMADVFRYVYWLLYIIQKR